MTSPTMRSPLEFLPGSSKEKATRWVGWRGPTKRRVNSVQLTTYKRLMIFSGTANRELAEEIAAHLGMKLSEVEIATFANSESYARFSDSVRGCDAFVIQSICDPV